MPPDHKRLLSNIDAVMVDLDGTMVDTMGDFEAALNLCLADIDLPKVSPAVVNIAVGKGSEHLIRTVLRHQLDLPEVKASGMVCDNTGVENLFERVEYIRQGLIWDNFMANFKIHYNNLEHTKADELKLKLTLNAFSIVNIADFVAYFKDYKVEFTYGYTLQTFLRTNILDLSFLSEVQRLEDYLKSSNTEFVFPNYQIIYDAITNDTANAKIFKSAITDLDEIRRTNWRTIFPEYQQWFDKI